MFIYQSIILFIVFIFFSWSMYSAAKLIPEDKQVFPAWMCWLMLVPVLGYIFAWLMMPFGIPRSFENYVVNNPQAYKDTREIFGLGLAFVILVFFGVIPILGFFAYAAAIVLLIVYWVKVKRFKETYLSDALAHG